MGPIPTLPPNQQPRPTNHNQRSRRPGPDIDQVLGVDQPAAPVGEPKRDGELAPEETALRLHQKVAEVDLARPVEEPEPLGRRLPAALEASRQGAER